ncbi:unnamed protein product [Protopolystoma xenopodis]|uniref:Uncharacterized protein n=1 Tax=Protopolystoma xenopodis TaxID=117903 RepID=A0A448XL83_9PLAT|nr:unnamed protein product [Protopolystoma xenopodis]
MTLFTDDADYDTDETTENVTSPRPNAENYENYFGRGLRTRRLQLSLSDHKAELRKPVQPASNLRKICFTNALSEKCLGIIVSSQVCRLGGLPPLIGFFCLAKSKETTAEALLREDVPLYV